MTPKMLLRSLADTTLKSLPIEESCLPENQKKLLKKGGVLPIDSAKIINGHLVFECFEDVDYRGKWYVNAKTVEMTVKE